MVECGGLENHCTERYRGFESLLLCKKPAKLLAFFMHKKRLLSPSFGTEQSVIKIYHAYSVHTNTHEQ